MISTELTILPDRIYIQTISDIDIDTRLQKKRQVSSMRYSLLAPVIFTVNILNRTTSAEIVFEMIRSTTDVSTDRSEIIGFNSVGMCIHIRT